MFAPEKVGGYVLGQFVTKPFTTWANKSQKMSNHGSLEVACSKMRAFLATYEQPSKAISMQLDTQAQKQLEENKVVLESLFKITMLLGKQGLAFRGHRDDKVSFAEQYDQESHNPGNFIELVCFRAETDPVLAKHLKNAPRNAKYTSKTTQNQMISIVGDHIRSELIQEIKSAKFYSLIADELSDISNKEQVSLSFRYVLEGSVKEVFADFIEVERITGKDIAHAIIQSLDKWDIPLQHLRGQCYDGASNMAGARSGCSAIIREKAPLAVYHHCAAHRLNLAVVSACKIMAFRNTESYIGEMARFFHFSAKRQRLLDKVIDSVCPNARCEKLKDTCKTRWIQHIDSYTVFMELLPAIHTTMQAIVCPASFQEFGSDWNWDGETVIKATGFIHQLESASFLVCFQILLECLSHLRGLTVKLQMQAIDVVYAYKQVHALITSLKGMRARADETFGKIFKDTTTLAKQIHGEDYELTRPRLNARQAHRANVTVQSVEEYFRITLYNEFLSHIVTELEQRFPSSQHQTLGLLQLLPELCSSREDTDIPDGLDQVVAFYSEDLPHPVMLPIEYRMWVQKWKEPGGNTPKKLVDVLEACDATSFPNIHVLLRLALTLPITSCECERSFSQLKLIKTAHRSTTTATRLSGLALMKINREKCDKIYSSHSELTSLVLTFSQVHSRKMKLPFILAD